MSKNYLSIYAKSFSWAGFFLPKKIYQRCSTLYDFCRSLDDIADQELDLNAKIDLNLRKNITVIRNLEIDDNKVSAGQSIFSLKFSADYALSRNFSAILFYDHLFSKYEISTAFPQTNIRSGFTFRYSFGN